jgi:14-3-3 protein epsilon
MATETTTSGGNPLDTLADGLDIKKLVELVRVAETAERYEDMCNFVQKLVLMKSAKQEDLDVDERNLLSVAYKNVVGAKRASWRTLSGGFDDADEELLNKYKNIVENELEAICQEVLDLLTKHLCENVKGNGDETEVFYLKMCGDYYRYLSEFRTESEEYKKKAEEFYKKAMDVAEANLNETHPTRLGLALNFSVCYYEILKEPEKACDLAKKSFDAAIEKLDTLNDASYKDSTLIMQLLRDNLTLWTSSQDDEEAAN